MIKIDKEMIDMILEADRLNRHITFTVDYKAEEKYAALIDKINSKAMKLGYKELLYITEFNDINNVENIYIYEPVEVIEAVTDDKLLWNCFSWLESDKVRADFIELEVLNLASNKELYSKCIRVKDIFMTTIEI